jgi:DNA-binding response OmpR family regulator
MKRFVFLETTPLFSCGGTMQSSLSSQQTGTGPQILVVSNDQHLQKLLDFFLTQAGYQVINAGHAEAFNAHQANEIDLVLLDLMLKPAEGFDVCQQLRCYSEVPMILLTEVNQPDQLVRGLELGADDAIYYPFAMVELVARTKALLRRQQWIGRTALRLAGNKATEPDASSPVWMRESLSWNKSAFASGMQG